MKENENPFVPLSYGKDYLCYVLKNLRIYQANADIKEQWMKENL